MKVILYLTIIIGCYLLGNIFYTNTCNKLKLIYELKNFHNDFIVKMNVYEISIKKFYLSANINCKNIIYSDINIIKKYMQQNRNISVSDCIQKLYSENKFRLINENFKSSDIDIICSAYKTTEISDSKKAKDSINSLITWLDQKAQAIKEKEMTKVKLIKKNSVLIGVLTVLLMI